MNRVFKYETPAWGAKLICSAYFLVSVILLISYGTYENWAGNSPWLLKYFFLILGLMFLLVSLKPKSWKGWVYFIADDNGLHFPSSPSPSDKPTFLNVKWEDVGIIKKEKLRGNEIGVTIELKITRTEIDSYFRNVARANKILGCNQMRGEYFVIAYGNNAFQKISHVVKQLLAIKSQNI